MAPSASSRSASRNMRASSLSGEIPAEKLCAAMAWPVAAICASSKPKSRRIGAASSAERREAVCRSGAFLGRFTRSCR